MKHQLLHWLLGRLISRAYWTPYFHIAGKEDQSLYMLRWWLFGGSYRDDKRTPEERGWEGSRLDRWIGRWVCARLHHTLRSDSDRHLHDHPAWSISLVLAGGYTEVLPVDQDQEPLLDSVRGHYVEHWRAPGAIVFRRATDRHRLIIHEGREPWSLFILGPIRNKWGFYTPEGKVWWKRYLGLEEAQS